MQHGFIFLSWWCSSCIYSSAAVSKARHLPISAASFLVSKSRPPLLGQWRAGWEFSFGSNPVTASISKAKQVTEQILEPDWISTQPCSDPCSVRTDARVSSMSQIRVTSTSKHQLGKTETCQLSRGFPAELRAGQLFSHLTEHTG